MSRSTAAIIVCGGQSRRMGRPKAWLPFGDETLLERVVRLAGSVADPVVVVAAPDQELPSLAASVRVVRDPIAFRGPLQGIATGLAALPDSVEAAFATGTDVPFLEPLWITFLAERLGGRDVAIPFVDGFHHPLAAVYRRATVLPAARALLAEDRPRPVFLLERLPTTVVSAEELRAVDPALGTLRNLNTPEDYDQALREAGLAGSRGPGGVT